MESRDLKKLFKSVAKSNGFVAASGAWFKQSSECIVILELQKSNFENYYDLNIKTYIQGVFGVEYIINKDLVKKDVGDLFVRQPQEYNDIFDLDTPIEDEIRKNKMEFLFSNFIVPNTDQTLSREGIVELARKGEFILPAIKKELGI